jgi:periplasmic protein CpxP/Spy
MLKHCLLSLMLAGLLYAAAPTVIAQNSQTNDQSAQEGAPPEHGRGGHFDPQRMTNHLTKQLNLTSDQQGKVLDILKSQQSQMESLHSDTSLSQQDRRQKMMDIRKASDEQIRGLLNPDQQKKWDAMQSEHRGWQGKGQQSAPPSPNPQ